MDRSHAFLMVCMVTACLALATKKEIEPQANPELTHGHISIGPNSALSISMENFDESDLYPGSTTLAAQLEVDEHYGL